MSARSGRAVPTGRDLPPWRDRRLLTLGAVAVVVTSGLALLVPVFPAYVAERDGTGADLGLLNASYALALFVAAPVWGAASDRLGRRAVLAIGPVGLGASYLAMAGAPTVELAILLRVFGGVFAAATIPTSFAYVADTTHGAARARGMGFLSAAMGLAFVFSPVIGGALGNLGTSLPFLGAGLCAFAGAILVVVALPAIPAAGHDRSADGRSRRARFVGDLRPLLPILVVSFLVSTTDGSRNTAVALDAAGRFGATAGDLGLLFATVGLSFVVAQVALTGRLIDRFGERTSIAAGALVTAVGFLLVPLATGLLPLAGALAIQGLGVAMGFAAIPAYISHTAPGGQGMAMGWRSATQSAGQVVGPIVAGRLFEIDGAWPAIAAGGFALLGAIVAAQTLRPLVVHDHEHAAPVIQEPAT